MKRILNWLGSKTDTADAIGDIEPPSKSDVAGWMADTDSSEEDYTLTVPILKILDPDKADEHDAADPGDTTGTTR